MTDIKKYEYRVVYEQDWGSRWVRRSTDVTHDEAKARRWKREIKADARAREVVLKRREVIPWEVME